MWIAFDDTDSLAGGCTTHLATLWIAGLQGVDLIGPPRLVRLNPNVPHRTRGNGALAVELGHGEGCPRTIGEWGDRRIVAYERGAAIGPRDAERAFQQARALVEAHARRFGGAEPAIVCASGAAARFYWEAVHRYVSLHETDLELTAVGASWTGWGAGRGRLGALAAIAWPGEHGTYETISYREPGRVGSPRAIPSDVGPLLDREFPSTFDNWDPVYGRLRIAPHTPCPVLVGVRGTTLESTQGAIGRTLAYESAAGWMTFWTNQATDDHRRPVGASQIRPFTSVRLRAVVARAPVTRPGGHVLVRVRDASGEADLAAFEPTRSFRDAVRTLHPGDAVEAHGAVHEDPTLVALERLDVLESPPRMRSRAPACIACDRRMASRGAGAGYRCDRCGQRRAEPETWHEPGIPIARHEVPVLVRRHLSRPLSLPEAKG